MKNFNIKMLVLSVSLACSASAMAAAMTKDEFKAEQDKISAEYKTGKAACSSLSGNASDICIAEAKGKESVALADLDASYKPTSKTHYMAALAKAKADYAVADERCDDLAGNAKDVCVKEAKAAQATAKADAKAKMKTSDAKTTSHDKSSEARSEAKSKAVDARNDATATKNDAEYAVAKEKCDSYSGSAKDLCVSEAKTRFGKS